MWACLKGGRSGIQRYHTLSLLGGVSMPLSDDEKETLRIEKLIAEVNTRENSTFVISTVASSVSLAILTTLFDKSLDMRMSWGAFGFLFASLGFAYRELTIHFSEISSYRELRKKLSLPREGVSFRVYIRMVIVRWFLLLPSAVFFNLIGVSGIICAFGATILSLTFSMSEVVRRVDC